MTPDFYDIRRENLRLLLLVFDDLGYNRAYLNHMANRIRRSSGTEVIVTDRVIDKIVRKLNSPSVTRAFFDVPSCGKRL